MSDQYELQGTFNIQQIVASMKEIAEEARKSGVDTKKALDNSAEGKKLIAMYQGLEKQIEEVRKKTDSLAQSAVKYVKETDKIAPASHKAASGVGTMNSALGQFGYILGDADMFLVNFQMGIRSVANNIPIAVQMFTYANEEAKKLNQTLGQSLIQSLKGPGGLLIAINGVMLLMNVFASVFASTTKEIKAQRDEVQELIKKYRELSTVELAQEMKSLTGRETDLTYFMNELRKQFVKRRPNIEDKTFSEEWISSAAEEQFNKLKVELDLVQMQLQKIKEAAATAKTNVSEIMKGTFDISTPANIDRAINILMNERNSMNKQEREQLNEKIRKLQQIRNEMQGEIDLKEKSGAVTSRYEAARKNAAKTPIAGLDAAGMFPIGALNLGVSETEMSKFLESVGYNPVDKMTDQVNKYEQAWNRAGSVMTSALSQSLGLLRQTDSVLGNIINSLLSMGIQMAMSGLWGGLFSLMNPSSGLGFMGGFMKAIGLAEGGILNEPVAGIGLNSKRSYLMGEAGPEAVMPLNRMPMQYPSSINLNIAGEFRARGNEMYAVIKRIEKLEKRFK